MVVRLCLLICLTLATWVQAKPLLVGNAQLAKISSNVKTSLLRKCDGEIGAPKHAVADFAPKPRYTATGVNLQDDLATGLTQDFRRAYRMALCFRFSGDQQYASEAQSILDTWAKTMKFASSLQGRGSLNFNAAQLVVAASWVEGVNDWNAEPLKSWLRTVIAPLSLSGEPNNRGNWGVLQDASIAAFAGDTMALMKASGRWQSLLVAQIASDGTLPMEICRGNTSKLCSGPDKGVNGMAYTHFTLLPAILAAEIFEEHGNRVYQTKAGQALKSALTKSADFTANPWRFPYYKSNSGKLNKLDHCAYFYLMLNRVADKNASAMVAANKCRSDTWLLRSIFPRPDSD